CTARRRQAAVQHVKPAPRAGVRQAPKDAGRGPGRRVGTGGATTLWGRVYPARRSQADATHVKPPPLAGIKPAPQGAEPGPGRRVGAGAATTLCRLCENLAFPRQAMKMSPRTETDISLWATSKAKGASRAACFHRRWKNWFPKTTSCA